MAISSLQASRIICELKNWSVSNLALQKILYIAHGFFMAGKGSCESPLIDRDFYAWHYGPVEVDLYHKFKIFGAGEIEEDFLTTEHETDGFDSEKEEDIHIQKIVEALCDATPSELVAMTHQSGGAWARHYNPSMSKLIDRKDIYNEFRGN